MLLLYQKLNITAVLLILVLLLWLSYFERRMRTTTDVKSTIVRILMKYRNIRKFFKSTGMFFRCAPSYRGICDEGGMVSRLAVVYMMKPSCRVVPYIRPVPGSRYASGSVYVNTRTFLIRCSCTNSPYFYGQICGAHDLAQFRRRNG